MAPLYFEICREVIERNNVFSAAFSESIGFDAKISGKVR